MTHTPLTFDPHQQFRRIVLVGVGGTGGILARNLCRILWDMARRKRQIPTLTIIDPDRVALHNVGRQQFTPADVGGYKAEILAKRFSYALGLEVRWMNAPFAVQHAGSDVLLLGAVDNHLARRELVKACEQFHICYIDAGNEHQTGQVVLGNCGDEARIRARNHDGRIRWLPHVGRIFPQILEPEPTFEPSPPLSCADLTASGDQHLLVNDAVATVAAHYAYKLLHQQPLASHLTYLDMDGMNVRSQPISRELFA